MQAVTVRAPAKINLFLRVVGRRPDGYHELVSLMCPVGLYDILTLTFGGGNVSVACDHPHVPADDSNLVVRAARLVLAAAAGEVAVDGVHIHLVKNIPVGAGLGGGSSDAAAVMTALNDRLGRPLDTAGLMALGARVGADVPFFFCRGPALARGIGDRLEPFPLKAPMTALLVYPNVVVDTGWVYKNLNLRLTKDEKKLSKFHFDGRFMDVAVHLVNDLEPVTEKAFPVISQIKRELLAHGAVGALMSGSGSTVFGLFSDSRRAVSALAAMENYPQRQNWTLFVADLLI